MRAVNLLTLAEGFETVPTELMSVFEAQLSEREEPLDSVKPHEAACVIQVTHDLRETSCLAEKDFAGFAYSFRIPQISSEFDLLKVASDAVLNIELKAQSVGEDRIERQLRRNRYYLGPLGRRIFTFAFVLEPHSLYELREDGHFGVVSTSRLVEVMSSVGKSFDGQMEGLFRASDYLVSPLNDTKAFLEGKYFLTNHQEQIKTNFLRACATAKASEDATACEPPAYLVYGASGTGKSLLLYDLARSLCTSHPVCVVHCGLLAPGHEALNAAQDRFRILPAKGSERLDLSAYGALLVDEAQRMWPAQLQSVTQSARRYGLPIFLSLDRQQVLGQAEGGEDTQAIVSQSFPHLSTWQLSRKIRTNRGLTGFIRTFFGLRGHREKVHTRHVKIAHAADAAHASELVEVYRADGYQYIRLGTDVGVELTLQDCPTTNEVVGQEFDRVVMAIGPEFCAEGATTRAGAIVREHVFQGLTRARSDLALVVYQNPALLERLLQIVS